MAFLAYVLIWYTELTTLWFSDSILYSSLICHFVPIAHFSKHCKTFISVLTRNIFLEIYTRMDQADKSTNQGVLFLLELVKLKVQENGSTQEHHHEEKDR